MSAPVPARQPPGPPSAPPTLAALFRCFLHLGAVSFGGGMSAWIRREVVQRRNWIDETQFLSGLALSQIAPGPNAVNLSVFIGTTLLGTAGAVVALLAMLAVPVAVLLAAGTAYFVLRAMPQGAWFATLLAGAGAAAIGLNLANGIRLTSRNVRGPAAWTVMVGTAAAVGIFRVPLLWALLGAIPASLLLTARGGPPAP